MSIEKITPPPGRQLSRNETHDRTIIRMQPREEWERRALRRRQALATATAPLWSVLASLWREELGRSTSGAEAMTLGSHGDAMVALPRHATVNGTPLPELVDEATLERLFQRTRDGGAEIVGLLKTGSAYYAPSSSVVAMVEPTPAARFLRFDTFDRGYFNGWDLKSAMHPQTILAYAFNDRALTPAHGAPLRLYSPVKLGYKLTKYLTKMTFTAERPGGYWEDQGYPWLGGV